MADTIMGLLNPAIAAIFAAIFAVLWLRDRSAKHVAVLALGYLGLATGFLVFHFSPDPEAVSWTVLMHLIYSVSAGGVCWAAAFRCGQRVRWPALVAITVIASVLIVAGSLGSDMNARMIAANTSYGLMFALTTQVIGRSGKKGFIDQAVYWLFAITAAQFFIRPQIAAILSGPMSAEMYRASEFYAVWILTMGIVSLLLGLSLIGAILHDQLYRERELAELDHLTGLKMRGAFESAAMTLLDENADRRVPVSMIVADIDHFKQVNDTFGHQAGDGAIADFGKLIGDTVRDSDICGRVGGEEFCILVWNCDLSGARNLAERLRRAFGRMEHDRLPGDIRLTSSFGVAQAREGEGYGKLFARADKALYDAKSSGRDCVRTSGQPDVVQPLRATFSDQPQELVQNASA